MTTPTHAHISVATVMLKAVRSQVQRYQGYVRRIHSLEAESSAVAVKISIFDKVLDGLYYLHANRYEISGCPSYTFLIENVCTLLNTDVEWRAVCGPGQPSSTTTYLLQQGSLFQACFKHDWYTNVRVDTVSLSSKLAELSLVHLVVVWRLNLKLFEFIGTSFPIKGSL